MTLINSSNTVNTTTKIQPNVITKDSSKDSIIGFLVGEVFDTYSRRIEDDNPVDWNDYQKSFEDQRYGMIQDYPYTDYSDYVHGRIKELIKTAYKLCLDWIVLDDPNKLTDEVINKVLSQVFELVFRDYRIKMACDRQGMKAFAFKSVYKAPGSQEVMHLDTTITAPTEDIAKQEFYDSYVYLLDEQGIDYRVLFTPVEFEWLQ